MSFGIPVRNGLMLGVSTNVALTARRFTPASLFAANERGFWYDPSDSSTLFQDTAGSTPVTTAGQTVALMLDKSATSNFPLQFFPTLPIPYGSTKTAIQAGLEVNAAISNAGVYYVKPSTGSDANPGTLAQPFATVARAMRTATGAATRVAMLEDCVIPPFDLRNTDASQTTQQFKWLDANGYNITIRVTGPALSSQTWAQDGTFTNCWKTTLAVGASQTVTRVLNTAVLDDYGYDTPLRQYASATALNSASDAGYYWDNAGKVLWLNIGGNVETQKANYRALYTDTAGTSRIYVQGSALGLSGVKLEGVQFLALDGGGRRPEFWVSNVTQLWANDKGADFRGWFIATNSLCYAAQSDGANGFVAWAAGKSFIQTVNCRYIRSGDVRTFAVNNTLQGVSAHGGCLHVSFGSQFIQNNGQGVADTCVNSSTDYSWLLDCVVVGGAAGITAANVEFGSAATSATRFAFVQNLTSSNAPVAGDLRVSTNGIVQRFGLISGTIVGTVLPYGNHATQATLGNRTQYQVDGSGRAYLQFDGTDDFLQTGTITPNTDKAQIFAGVQKASDAAQGVVLEASASIAANNGALLLAAPDSAGTATYAFDSKGTVQVDAVATGFAAPNTSVLTGLSDISGDVVTIRVNGVQVDQDTADQGTGNYLAYPFFIGRRAGTSLAFNGRLYSLIARFGANLSTPQITAAEIWVNSKTGAY